MRARRITAMERDKLLSMMDRLPIAEVERVSGRSVFTLFRLMVAQRGPSENAPVRRRTA